MKSYNINSRIDDGMLYTTGDISRLAGYQHHNTGDALMRRGKLPPPDVQRRTASGHTSRRWYGSSIRRLVEDLRRIRSSKVTTVRGAARILGLPYATVYDMKRRGPWPEPCEVYGNRKVYSVEDIRRLGEQLREDDRRAREALSLRQVIDLFGISSVGTFRSMLFQKRFPPADFRHETQSYWYRSTIRDYLRKYAGRVRGIFMPQGWAVMPDPPARVTDGDLDGLDAGSLADELERIRANHAYYTDLLRRASEALARRKA